MAKSVAYPVVGLGVSTAALASGFDQAQAVAKAGMDKVASAVQSVSVRPLFDTSNITKGLEAALSKVEEFKKKSSSIDMIGKLSASQNPFFAMAQSGPKGKGPAVDMIGQLGEWQADKAVKARVEEDQAWKRQFDVKSASIQKWLDTKNAAEAAKAKADQKLKDYWDNIRYTFTTFGKGLDAVSKSTGFDWFVRTVGNPLSTLTKWSMPINQTLELAGKVNRVLGAPIRSAMAMEAGRDDVAAGGLSLLGSNSLSGTMARFEIEVTRTFANIWNAIDQTFDIQGLMEYFRGMLAGVSVLIESVFGPVEEFKKDPKFLTEAFKQGALSIVDAFETSARFAVNIQQAFYKVLEFLSKIPGVGAILPKQEFNAKEEAKIKEWQERNSKFQIVNDPWFGQRKVELVKPSREKAIEQLQFWGALPKVGEDALMAIDEFAENARERIGKMGLAPDVPPGDARKASLAIDDFTRSLRSANDSLYALELAAAQDAERIAQMENQGADPLDVFLAQSAADLAQGARVLEFAARQMPRDTAISAASQGSQALADALGRAMSTQSGRDIQSEIKSAIEEQVRQQQETNRLQMEALQIWNRFKPGQQVQVRGV